MIKEICIIKYIKSLFIVLLFDKVHNRDELSILITESTDFYVSSMISVLICVH